MELVEGFHICGDCEPPITEETAHKIMREIAMRRAPNVFVVGYFDGTEKEFPAKMKIIRHRPDRYAFVSGDDRIVGEVPMANVKYITAYFSDYHHK